MTESSARFDRSQLKPLTLDQAWSGEMAKAALSKGEDSESLMKLGPEQVVDGYELCPQCWGAFAGYGYLRRAGNARQHVS